MEHLSVDEIIDFVSFEKWTEETAKLASIVNGHIYKCKECRTIVTAFQQLHDEFEDLCAAEDFKEYTAARYYGKKITVKTPDKRQVEFEGFER